MSKGVLPATKSTACGGAGAYCCAVVWVVWVVRGAVAHLCMPRVAPASLTSMAVRGKPAPRMRASFLFSSAALMAMICSAGKEEEEEQDGAEPLRLGYCKTMYSAVQCVPTRVRPVSAV